MNTHNKLAATRRPLASPWPTIGQQRKRGTTETDRRNNARTGNGEMVLTLPKQGSGEGKNVVSILPHREQ